ncbi:hypothetical protein HT031_001953 [Scenedesmus sp. PABB004]|nr:hypothetical protein HT031_001953 [Scenedesmus sp. PABB004]
MQPPAAPAAADVRAALAVAIVRQKRAAAGEAAAWRAKAARLEEALAAAEARGAAVQAWAAGALRTAAAAAAGEDEQHAAAPPAGAAAAGGIFLPPLSLPADDCAAGGGGGGPAAGAPPAPRLAAGYARQQQQLLSAAQQAGAGGAAVAAALSGRAAALSTMLQTNARMTQLLQQLGGRAAAGDGDGAAPRAASAPPPARGAVTASLAGFVRGTLLQVPPSTLRSAYMQHCAALLGALLAQPARPGAAAATPNPAELPAPPALAGGGAAAPGGPLRGLADGRDDAGQEAAAAAVEAMPLLRALLQDRAAELQEPAAGQRAAAATAMLQALSALPGPALLVAVAVAHQLAAAAEGLQRANVAAAALRLPSTGLAARLGDAERALAAAAPLFEASAQLADDLVRSAAEGPLRLRALRLLRAPRVAAARHGLHAPTARRPQDAATAQLPAWAVALADCTWAPRALADLVAAAAAAYRACGALQPHQPLLVDAVCAAAARLATSLQHVATRADAPGMRDGAGAALRSGCVGLCMQLRDLFMPLG